MSEDHPLESRGYVGILAEHDRPRAVGDHSPRDVSVRGRLPPAAVRADDVAPGPLSSRVADLCAEVGNRLGGGAQTQVVDVRRRLGEPLRVAIAGRLKSGKSTLVNALIGRRVAPTEVGECTRIVTQFRYGTVRPGRRRANATAPGSACRWTRPA